MRQFVRDWKGKNNLLIWVILVVLFFVFPKNAYAYLDPGTGSYVLQIILAFVIGGLCSLKLYWKRIKVYFRRKFSKKGDDPETH